MKRLAVTETTIDAGATRPFRLLHVTDTHIALADEHDDERKRELAARRAPLFDGDHPGSAIEYFRSSAAFANDIDATLVHTGDLFDFVSHAHLALAPELLSLARDPLMVVGNHEFSQYVGEAFEDEKYKMLSHDHVQAMFPDTDLSFSSRVVNGVNLIGLDNVYYDFTADQTERLEAEVAKGMPIMLFLHVPLYTPQLWEARGGEVGNLVGVPTTLMESYDDHRYRQQITTPQTRKFLDHLYGLDCVRGVFAGHLHKDHESQLPNGVGQYVTGAQYNNVARLIEVH